MSHQARYSQAILDSIELKLGLTPAANALPVFDPFAGEGRGLGHVCDKLEIPFSGIDLEDWEGHDHRVRQADATDIENYPDERHLIICSPTYANGMCLTQEQRVLTYDLRWVPVGELEVGDELLAFDEEGPGLTARGLASRRRWRRSVVTHSMPRRVSCVRVIMENGDTVITTPEHPWLAWWVSSGQTAKKTSFRMAGMWVRSDRLLGWGHLGSGNRGPRRPLLVSKIVEPWSALSSYDAGWLAGMYDGEGSLHLGAAGLQGAPKLTMAQNDGPLMDRAEVLMRDLGFDVRVYVRKEGSGKMRSLYVCGGFPGILRALGQIRPMRLMEKWGTFDVSARTIEAGKVRVAAVEPAGRRDIQEITTSTRTYIGEGYLMHNSDHFLPRDGSKRYTYRVALGRDLHVNNSGRYGLRAGKKSLDIYWLINQFAVACWAELGWPALVNVKDFPYTEKDVAQIYPLVDLWMALLKEFGYHITHRVVISTPGNRNGANKANAVGHEVILAAEF